MTIWAVGSLRGSPGATTLAVGLAATWPTMAGRACVVVEADPMGGVLAARFDELRADKTIADAAVALRRQFDLRVLMEASRPVWGALLVVSAHPSANEMTSLLATTGEHLALGLASEADVDAIVDVGRLTAMSPAAPLARRAAGTLLVSRPRFEDVACLTTRVRELRAAGVDPWLVVVGSKPYDPLEVAAAANLPLLAVLPDDPVAAGVLTGERNGSGRLGRSLLWRTICELSSRLLQHAEPPATRSASARTVVPVPDPTTPEVWAR